jgi:protein-S-isoprenylcysteine O-methyltransferase Ste14
VEMVSLGLALVLLAAHFAAEPLLRRGRARNLVTTSFESGSTLLVTALGLASVVSSFAARFAVERGRFAPRPGVVVVLGLAMLAGVALRYWSMLVLGEFFTRTLAVLPGQSIVSAGPYRVIRHPGYLAQIVVVTAGCALASLNVWLVALTGPLLFAAYAYRIRAEERMLGSQFGEAYQDYRSRTWRLIY